MGRWSSRAACASAAVRAYARVRGCVACARWVRGRMRAYARMSRETACLRACVRMCATAAARMCVCVRVHWTVSARVSLTLARDSLFTQPAP